MNREDYWIAGSDLIQELFHQFIIKQKQKTSRTEQGHTRVPSKSFILIIVKSQARVLNRLNLD